MQKTKEVSYITHIITAIQCDKCKKEYDIEDILNIQEFHHIKFIGGYSSVFGDGTIVEADICQKCLYELISPFARMEYSDFQEYNFKEIE